MSSMRNAVQRRPHRERAQPLERRRLGLLEKHKDYSKRAKDYNEKKKQLKNLRQKASERNEDEFYFGMLSRQGPGLRLKEGKKWTGNVKGDRGNKTLDQETVRSLKTQDLAYVRTMRNVAAKEVKRLEEQLVLSRGYGRYDEDDEKEGADDDDDSEFDFGAPQKKARKIVFFDNEEEMEEAVDQAAEDEDLELGDDDDKPKEGKKAEEEAQRADALWRLKRRLASTKKKLEILEQAEQELDETRAKMAKTATSGGTTRRGQKLKVRARKR
ncbi:small-subunit processome [Emericellopsis atlantica]|uniref:U3 small nucleolar RNA-associated protein 11 n=1 Tax=Emericellopsis atlantica TaxID=2614577 RepID=A0A9P8CQ28_9HYPO|nr:small-subunit processome [Emericellopsis atlantica]KAG9254847.1 small-subunit processome [Emericellopsis atlantica]